jgi:hypothetical protein
MNNKKFFASLLLLMIVFLNISSVKADELVLLHDEDWYWEDDTFVVSVAGGNVDADADKEVVTGGYYYDGTRNVAQLCVWNDVTLALERVRTWYWTGETGIESVAVEDVDADGDEEIITGGWYHDGIRYVAQLCVWDGATLTIENVRTWYWTDDTVIYAIAAGDVDGDGKTEIVTGGYHNDGVRDVAQLCVWDGATLTIENVRTWYWTGQTIILSVAIGNTYQGISGVDIVTGGYFYDGSRQNAQLCVWDGATLALDGVQAWYWTGNTQVTSLAIRNFGGGTSIITGGWFWDGTRFCSQVVVWKGLKVDFPVQWWYTDGHTKTYSLASGPWPYSIVACGSHWDSSYGFVAEIKIFEFFYSGGFQGWGTLVSKSWEDSEYIASVANVGGWGAIYTGGAYYDGERYVAQLAGWY